MKNSNRSKKYMYIKFYTLDAMKKYEIALLYNIYIMLVSHFHRLNIYRIRDGTLNVKIEPICCRLASLAKKNRRKTSTKYQINPTLEPIYDVEFETSFNLFNSTSKRL